MGARQPDAPHQRGAHVTSIDGAFGKWTQADLVARVRRNKNAKLPVAFLAIEVEQPGGFGIESVYQAYEVGRGADQSWIFYSGPKHDARETNRIVEAATDLGIGIGIGIGIVHGARPTRPADWKVIAQAKYRAPTASAREDFFGRSRLGPESFL